MSTAPVLVGWRVLRANEFAWRCPKHPLTRISPEGPGAALPIVRTRFATPWLYGGACETGCGAIVERPPESEADAAYDPRWTVGTDGVPVLQVHTSTER